MLAAGCIKPRTPTIHAAIGDSCQPFTRPLVTALETFALLLFRIHYVTFRLIASSLAVWPTTCALHHRVQHVTLTVTLTALRAIDHEAKTTALAHTNPPKKLITLSKQKIVLSASHHLNMDGVGRCAGCYNTRALQNTHVAAAGSG